MNLPQPGAGSISPVVHGVGRYRNRWMAVFDVSRRGFDFGLCGCLNTTRALAREHGPRIVAEKRNDSRKVATLGNVIVILPIQKGNSHRAKLSRRLALTKSERLSPPPNMVAKGLQLVRFRDNLQTCMN